MPRKVHVSDGGAPTDSPPGSRASTDSDSDSSLDEPRGLAAAAGVEPVPQVVAKPLSADDSLDVSAFSAADHDMVPMLSHIGGAGSPWAGERRAVAACKRLCGVFLKDDGSLGCLSDPMAKADRTCMKAPVRATASHSNDPTKWRDVAWRELILELQPLTAAQQEMAKLTMVTFSRESPMVAHSLLERAGAMLALLMRLRSGTARDEDEVLVVDLAERWGRDLFDDRARTFCSKHLTDPAIVVLGVLMPWAPYYLKSLEAAYDRVVVSTPLGAPRSDLLSTLMEEFQWPSNPTRYVNLRVLRVRVAILTLASLVNPTKYALTVSLFNVQLWDSLVDTYYDKVVLGRMNVLARQAATEARPQAAVAKTFQVIPAGHKGSRGRSPRTVNGPVAPGSQRFSAPDAAPRQVLGKRAASASIPGRGRDASGQAKTLYTQCQKCARPVPTRSGQSTRPLCRTCGPDRQVARD